MTDTGNEWWRTNIQSQRRTIRDNDLMGETVPKIHLNAGIERQFWKLFGKQEGITVDTNQEIARIKTGAQE